LEFKDIGFRKAELVAKTQFLCFYHILSNFYPERRMQKYDPKLSFLKAYFLFVFPVCTYSLILLFSYSLILLFSYSLILLFSYSLILLFSYSLILFTSLQVCPSLSAMRVNMKMNRVCLHLDTTYRRIVYIWIKRIEG